MPRSYVVEQGDDLIGIAGRFGFADVEKIKSANPDLGRKAEVLYPGDVVTIPDLTVTKLDGKKESKNVFKLQSPRRKLKIPLQDVDGKPMAHAKYTLAFTDEHCMPRDGTTDAGGIIDVEVSWKETEVAVALENVVLRLKLGHLNPLDGTDDGGRSGIAQRLTLLGYYHGPLDGDADALEPALAAFQHDQKLPETGEADPDTLAKLDQLATPS
jgi:hypothetical protein